MTRFFPNNRKFAWDSSKSQKWNTAIQRAGSGMTRTMTSQFYPAWTIKASYPGLTDDEARELQGFVSLCKGSHEPVWWLDPEDYEVKGLQIPAINSTQYQAVMQQGGFVEPVEYIDNVTVYVNGVAQTSGFSVADGVITFSTAPSGIVTADYRYYWKMMFVDDGISIQRIYKNINKATIKLEVVR